MSIIISIHQPNEELFQMFDSVYVLAKGGVCVYSGLPQNLRAYLNECHIECTEYQNPIDVIIKMSDKNVAKQTPQLTPFPNDPGRSNLNPISQMTTTNKAFKLNDLFTL